MPHLKTPSPNEFFEDEEHISIYDFVMKKTNYWRKMRVNLRKNTRNEERFF